ncbi:MAG: cytidylate kinase [Actinomycetota bacterium]|nr:MAG: cytidylate kinase [Actinomycetota bacterium]
MSGRPRGRPRVVAIDGAAGVGKSTLAAGLAEALGLPYVNTGLMYRAVAAEALRRGVPVDDAEGLAAIADALAFRVAGPAPGRLEVEGWPEDRLRTVDVEAVVSAVAAHPAVRRRLRARQRAIGEERGAVMEGRDIGSVVFADAPVKLFVTAEPEVRAARRAAERGRSAAPVGAALDRRDARDARTNPLAPAPDATVIDTTDRTIAETLHAALEVVARAAPELVP